MAAAALCSRAGRKADTGQGQIRVNSELLQTLPQLKDACRSQAGSLVRITNNDLVQLVAGLNLACISSAGDAARISAPASPRDKVGTKHRLHGEVYTNSILQTNGSFIFKGTPLGVTIVKQHFLPPECLQVGIKRKAPSMAAMICSQALRLGCLWGKQVVLEGVKSSTAEGVDLWQV